MNQNKPIKIQVLIGTTRQGRFSEFPAQWIFNEAKNQKDWDTELVDLRDYPLPFYEEPISPSMANGNYTNEIAKKWAKKIAEADGYIIVTAEYNHGYPAVLKNALDYIYKEWNNKPVGFVSYGGVGGARSIEQLRQVVVELKMVPIKPSINIPGPIYMEAFKAPAENKSKAFEPLKEKAGLFLTELSWWAQALKEARKKN